MQLSHKICLIDLNPSSFPFHKNTFIPLIFFSLKKHFHSNLAHIPCLWYRRSELTLASTITTIPATRSHIQCFSFISLSNNHDSLIDFPCSTSKCHIMAFIIKLSYWDQIMHWLWYIYHPLDSPHEPFWHLHTNIINTNNVLRFSIR